MLRRIGLPDVYGESGPNDALLDRYGLSAARVAEQVRAAIHATTAATRHPPIVVIHHPGQP